MDSHRDIRDEDIPRLIDTLKDAMGIKNLPPASHCLYEHFAEYDTAGGVPIGFSPKVFELAQYGSYLEPFRKDWEDPKVLKHLRKRLLNTENKKGITPRSSVFGVLFEFQAAFHLTWEHKSASWSPNMSNESEFDIFVETHSSSKVLIECTRKQPKDDRINDSDLLIADVDAAVKEKLDKEAFSRSKAWVCVLLPEDIDWKEWRYLDRLKERMQDIFATERGSNLLGVSVVSRRPLREYTIRKNQKAYEDDFAVWSLRNELARNYIPSDFYPALSTDP